MDFRAVLGTSNKRRLALLEQLYYRRDGWSSDQLMSKLNCSLPILLNDIELINEGHTKFQIKKTKGLYRLVIDKKVSLGNLYANILTTNPEFQIIEELLYEECENITALAKKLYLSSSNTQRYLKKIEKTLTQAGMECATARCGWKVTRERFAIFIFAFIANGKMPLKVPCLNCPPSIITSLNDMCRIWLKSIRFMKNISFKNA